MIETRVADRSSWREMLEARGIEKPDLFWRAVLVNIAAGRGWAYYRKSSLIALAGTVHGSKTSEAWAVFAPGAASSLVQLVRAVRRDVMREAALISPRVIEVRVNEHSRTGARFAASLGFRHAQGLTWRLEEWAFSDLSQTP